MENDGCLICNAELTYHEKSEPKTCYICNNVVNTNTKCINGHFVCDACHEMEGFDYIDAVCSNSKSINPLALANFIMSNTNIKMHGPEHHFLVPAVLITCYYNKTGKPELIKQKLARARERAKNILGGFCGLYGNCGAGVGTGIFMSVILNSTPLSTHEWKLGNLITSKCLSIIANSGGPRCCKRNTFLSLETAITFIKEYLNVSLGHSTITCNYYPRNKECKKTDCRYFPH